MKLKITLITALLISCITFSQTRGINYKAVIKDNLGNVVANTNVNVQFTILKGVAQTNVYREIHTPTTDANGIIIVNIGEGFVVSGSFSIIIWSNDSYFLNTQINTGSGLVNLGTSEFKTVPFALSAANVTGLEALDEGYGIGWRLKGQNPDNYDKIGWGAVDLSNSLYASTVHGAHGDHSFAFGSDTQASGVATFAGGSGSKAMGQYSTAIGYYTEANGEKSMAMGTETFANGKSSTAMGYGAIAGASNSTAMGYFTYANGISSTSLGSLTEAIGLNSIATGFDTNADAENSTAMGNSTRASGIGSTAMGNTTTASGDNSTSAGYHTSSSNFASTALGNTTEASGNGSTSMGFSTTASGNYSTAMGSFTISKAYSNLAIGRYNVGSGSSGSWINSEPIFEIGNGTATNNRNNALTVLKNGNVGIGKSSGINGRVEIASASGLTSPQLYINETTTGYARLNFSNANRSDYWAIGAYIGATSSADRFNFYNSGTGTDIMSIEGSGNVRVNGAIVHSSDIRLKKDITPIPYGLKEVLLLQPKSYNWINRETDYKSLGLIAQEVQPLIKEIVHTDADETKTLSISYTELIPILIQAIKEQQEIIDSQKTELSTLNNDYKALLSRIEVLETHISN